MAEDSDNLDFGLKSIESRGYEIRLDPKTNQPSLWARPGDRAALTDRDFAFLKANKPKILERLIKTSDQPVEQPFEEQFAMAAGPAAMGTGGAALGEMAASRLGLGTAGRMAAKLGGGTAGNLASQYLPESMGGAQDPALGRALVQTGVQEALPGLGALATRGSLRAGDERMATEAESLAAQRATETSDAASALRKATSAQQTAGRALQSQQASIGAMLNKGVGQRLAGEGMQDVKGALGYQFEPAQTGGLAGDPARAAYLKAAGAARRETGAPLGEAYKALKLSDEAAPALNIGEIPQDVIGLLSPRAKALIAKGNKFGEQVETQEGAPLLFGAGGEVVSREPVEQPKQLGLDDLRQYRQEVSKAVKGAQGADRDVYRKLRDAADDALAPHLPLEVQALRAAHVGTMRDLPYKTDAQVFGASNPADVAEHVFSSLERAKTVIRHIDTPEDREALQHGFTQYVMSKVNPQDSVEKQLSSMQRALEPYQRHGIIGQMFGPKTDTTIKDALSINKNLYKFQTTMMDTKWQKAFDEEFEKYMATPEGKAAYQQIEQGHQKLAVAVQATDEGKQRLAQAPTYMGTALSPQAARVAGIQEHLEEGTSGGLDGMIKHRLMHHLLWAGMGGRLSQELSHPFTMGATAGVGAMLAWDATMRAGAAAPLATMLASDSARTSARNFARYLTSLGAHMTPQEGQQSNVVMPQ